MRYWSIRNQKYRNNISSSDSVPWVPSSWNIYSNIKDRANLSRLSLLLPSFRDSVFLDLHCERTFQWKNDQNVINLFVFERLPRKKMRSELVFWRYRLLVTSSQMCKFGVKIFLMILSMLMAKKQFESRYIEYKESFIMKDSLIEYYRYCKIVLKPSRPVSITICKTVYPILVVNHRVNAIVNDTKPKLASSKNSETKTVLLRIASVTLFD